MKGGKNRYNQFNTFSSTCKFTVNNMFIKCFNGVFALSSNANIMRAKTAEDYRASLSFI